MSYYNHKNQGLKETETNQNNDSNSETSSRSSSPISSSSSSSFSSDGTSSSSDLDPSDALQSPLAGLLKFEGFSMPQITRFNISNIDITNLPSFPNLRSFNMPSFQPRFPDIAMNLTNLQNFGTNQFWNFNMPNLSYLSQLANVDTSAELQNLFNLFRISASLPDFPQLPRFPQLPQLPQLPPFFSAQLPRAQLVKPWVKSRESVRNMHKRLNDISQRVPTNFEFHTWQSQEGVDFIRIYFLLNNYICYCDSPKSDCKATANNLRSNYHGSQTSRPTNPESNQPSPSTSSDNSKDQNISTQPNPLRHALLSTKPLFPPDSLIDEPFDISSFEYEPKKSRFVFSVGIHVYYFDDEPSKSKSSGVPIQVPTSSAFPKTDLKICPCNPDIVAFCCDKELWCVNLKTSQEVRLSNASGDADDRANSYISNNSGQTDVSGPCVAFRPNINDLEAQPVLAGRPSFIVKEEFKRNRSFWWSPPSNEDVVMNKTNMYSVLYEETDQTRVELVTITSGDGTCELQRFPKSGQLNPLSKLRLATFKMTAQSEIIDSNTFDVVSDLKKLYPDYEYLVRAGWLDSDVVWCQMLNRRQTNLVIAFISLSKAFEPQIIYEESNEFWVGAHDIFYGLDHNEPLTGGSVVSFIWSSEQSHFRHLYLISVRIGGTLEPPKILQQKQLTEGNWEINEKDLWVNERDKLIYFTGLRDTPLEKHLYVLSYADILGEKHNHNKVKIHRLTEINFTHSQLAFDATRSIYINIQSNITVPPFGFVNRIVHHSKHHRRRLPDSKRIALLLVNSFIYNHSQEAVCLDYLKSIGSLPSSITYECQLDLLPGLERPELFCCRLASGELIYGSIFKPEFVESGVRYPTVLEIYGGPETQLVSNDFMSMRQPSRHLLTSEGYVVVLIDCRGSGRRGLYFEAHTARRMGQVEIADQVEVLRWLAKNTDYIDLERVAVKGWSYGGYLSLMALAQYPDIFKIAIAGAPVTDWHLYNSAYTERFMGLPEENPDGYFKSNVLNYVAQFPDQENRLLLLHGMKDENVHFSHTVSLIKALVEAGKPYDLRVFPMERHILNSLSSCENYMTYVLSYLQLNL